MLSTNPDYGDGGRGPKTIEVLWDGARADLQFPDPSARTFAAMNWELHTVDVVATATVTHLSFQSGNASNSGPALDRITLDPVP